MDEKGLGQDKKSLVSDTPSMPCPSLFLPEMFHLIIPASSLEKLAA